MTDIGGAIARALAVPKPGWMEWSEAELREWNSQGKSIKLVVPWPPSVNNYWRMGNGRIHLNRESMNFRSATRQACKLQADRRRFEDDIELVIAARAPDRRRRDLDNILKALLDSLVSAGLLLDDSQVAALHVFRLGPAKPGIVGMELTGI